MIRMPATLAAWNTPEFKTVLQGELHALDPAPWPLQQGLAQGSHALLHPLHFIPLSWAADASRLSIRVGIAYNSVLAGCSCADDPTPVDLLSEYCIVLLQIDTGTAATTVALQEE